MSQPLYTNRLIHEKSPYLLQHAHNPVDWYPWGDEAFQAAKENNLPIFLSIGYSTCHWCHVMEKESFENPEIARLLNEAFINVKVDREELPEVDSLYMEFGQSMMAGAAGWPLNLILTPDLVPFFASTYLPPESAQGVTGIKDVIRRISLLWTEEKEKILDQSEKIVEIFDAEIHVNGETLPSDAFIQHTTELFFRMADPIYGGIKGEPKFPIGYHYSFLLQQFQMHRDNRTLYLVEKTLTMMHRGGIYDHLGGGFSRYSVDEEWLVPHFEKMLYDNALLAQVYVEAWQLTKNNAYKNIAQEILGYVLRDMTHPEGGFFSAEDADSEGHEGLFYTWTIDEVNKVLGEDAPHFCDYFGMSKEGNFEGRNILYTELSIDEYAEENKMHPEAFAQLLQKQKHLLWKERETRVHPFKDDKILTSWNGLMIYTLALAGCAFNHQTYLNAAVKSAQFIRRHLWKDGMLYRRWREGQTRHPAALEEYAYLIRGLIALFEANAGAEWLIWAIELSEKLKNDYKHEGGAFFQTDGNDPHLVLRKCQFSDGAEPSGNAIQTENLLKLYQLTADQDYLYQAEDVLKAVEYYLDSYPLGYCYHLMNLQKIYDKKKATIVIVLNPQKEFEGEIRQCLFQQFNPHKVVIWWNHDVDLEERIPFLQDKKPEDKTTVYICHEGYCESPKTTWEEIRNSLKSAIG